MNASFWSYVAWALLVTCWSLVAVGVVAGSLPSPAAVAAAELLISLTALGVLLLVTEPPRPPA